MILFGDQHVQTHSLRRVSRKGTPFVGVCTKCGQEGLTVADMNMPCANPNAITDAEALLELLEADVPYP